MLPNFTVTRPQSFLLGLYVDRHTVGDTRTGFVVPVALHDDEDRPAADLLVATHTLGTDTITAEPQSPFTDEQIARGFSAWYDANVFSVPDKDGTFVECYPESTRPTPEFGVLPGVTGAARLVVSLRAC